MRCGVCFHGEAMEANQEEAEERLSRCSWGKQAGLGEHLTPLGGRAESALGSAVTPQADGPHGSHGREGGLGEPSVQVPLGAEELAAQRDEQAEEL